MSTGLPLRPAWGANFPTPSTRTAPRIILDLIAFVMHCLDIKPYIFVAAGWTTRSTAASTFWPSTTGATGHLPVPSASPSSRRERSSGRRCIACISQTYGLASRTSTKLSCSQTMISSCRPMVRSLVVCGVGEYERAGRTATTYPWKNVFFMCSASYFWTFGSTSSQMLTV